MAQIELYNRTAACAPRVVNVMWRVWRVGRVRWYRSLLALDLCALDLCALDLCALDLLPLTRPVAVA